MRVQTVQSCFCLVFSQKFNIMSALSGHQLPTLPQKIDSREGWFWCKKGVACEWGKMNFYLKTPPFVPVFGLFAAKCIAIWCKTYCNMVQNAVYFGAKCSAFWCKMQGVLVQNAVLNGAKCEVKSIIIHSNGIKQNLLEPLKHDYKRQNIHQKVGF